MKKLLFSLAILFFMNGANAQYLDVIDVYFTDDPASNPTVDTGLVPNAQMILKFVFKNNLNPPMDIQPGDSITFGVSFLGTRVGTTGTPSWPNLLTSGSTARLYSHGTVPMPKDSCYSWEVCIWPLYNPYAPNKDSLRGNHCVTFRTTCDTFVMPMSIDTNTTDTTVTDTTSNDTTIIDPKTYVLKNENHIGNFFVSQHTLHYEFANQGKTNKIELFNLEGRKLMSEVVTNQGNIILKNGIRPGIYVLRAIQDESEIIQKVFIE